RLPEFDVEHGLRPPEPGVRGVDVDDPLDALEGPPELANLREEHPFREQGVRVRGVRPEGVIAQLEAAGDQRELLVHPPLLKDGGGEPLSPAEPGHRPGKGGDSSHIRSRLRIGADTRGRTALSMVSVSKTMPWNHGSPSSR